MNRSADRRPQGDDPTGSATPGAGDVTAPGGGVRAALVVVSALLLLEAAAVVALLIWLIADLLTLQPSSIATAVALIVLVAVGAAWLVAVALASLRRRPWSRASAIVWQVLQISIAVGAFQGLFARPDIGWVLLVPAITVIGLLLWTPVRLAYARPEDAVAG